MSLKISFGKPENFRSLNVEVEKQADDIPDWVNLSVLSNMSGRSEQKMFLIASVLKLFQTYWLTKKPNC